MPNSNWEPERANQNCLGSHGTKKKTKFKSAVQLQRLSQQKGYPGKSHKNLRSTWSRFTHDPLWKMLHRDAHDTKIMWDSPLQNVKEVLKGFPTRNVYDRLGSTVALHWICGSGEYKQFVGNQVRKIQEEQINWKHVPTEQNPEDVGSWGGDVS